MKRKTPLLALLLLLVAGRVASIQVQPALAATGSVIDVNTTMDELNNDGNCSLREAIRAANLDTAVDACPAGSGADTINVPAGTYTLTLVGTYDDEALTGDLDVSSEITLTGAGASSTIIDGNDADRLFDVFTSARFTLSGVTLRHGNPGSTASGGAIQNRGSLVVKDSVLDSNHTGGNGGALDSEVTRENELTSASLSNVTIINNVAGIGGGGIESIASLTLANVTVTNNRANIGSGGGLQFFRTATMSNVKFDGNSSMGGDGGGIYAGGEWSLSDSSVTNNQAADAAGIINYGKATLTNVTVDGNKTPPNFGAPGGGILNEFVMSATNLTVSNNSAYSGGGIASGYELTLTNSTLSGNSSLYGGGLLNAGIATITNVTISGNTVSTNGGGLYSAPGGSAILTNVTFSANSAQSGGGIYRYQGTVSLKNTIVAYSPSGGNCGGSSLNSQGHNLSSDSTCESSFTAPGDRNNTDPHLGPLQNNAGPTQTHALLPGSPAIDAGDNNGCPATDQRGLPRPQDGNGDGIAICDIGAYEAPTVTLEPADLSIQKLAQVASGGSPIIFTLRVTNNGPTAAANVRVRDVLSDALAYESSSSTRGPCGYLARRRVVVCQVGTIAPRETVVVRVVTHLARSERVVQNCGRTRSSTYDPNPGNNRNCIMVQLGQGQGSTEP